MKPETRELLEDLLAAGIILVVVIAGEKLRELNDKEEADEKR